MEWNGEVYQDAFAYSVCGASGTFLDFGCERPIVGNNTYALERMGWRGILIDRDFRCAEYCRRIRTSLVLDGNAQDVDWRAICLLEGIGPSISYLSMDLDETETETQVDLLKKLFSDGFSFRVITLEHNAYSCGDRIRKPQRDLLYSHGYKLTRPDVPNSTGLVFEDWWTR